MADQLTSCCFYSRNLTVTQVYAAPLPFFVNCLISIVILQTRSDIDKSQAYVNTMSAKELWDYFMKNDNYVLKEGNALDGFMPDWIGEFYAYYQWYYNLPSSEVIKKSH